MKKYKTLNAKTYIHTRYKIICALEHCADADTQFLKVNLIYVVWL